MCAHEQTRRGLEMVVRASTDLSRLHGMHLFARGVVKQLCALLGIAPEGLICAQAGLQHQDDPARVIAAASTDEKLEAALKEISADRKPVKIDLSKEWCMKMAEREGNHEIGAGSLADQTDRQRAEALLSATSYRAGTPLQPPWTWPSR